MAKQAHEIPEALKPYWQDIKALAKPAIGLVQAKEPGFSKLGGNPNLPADVDWPTGANFKPMSFLSQLDLSAATNSEPAKRLALYFFYDEVLASWGSTVDDFEGWRVIATQLGDESPAERQSDKTPFRVRPLAFHHFSTDVDWLANDQALETSLGAPNFNAPDHWLFGYPAAVQSDDMDQDANAIWFKRYPKALKALGSGKKVLKAIKNGKHDWMLLLQLDSDEELGLMWGDMGRLYFWIRKDDLAAGNFDDVWCFLQCS